MLVTCLALTHLNLKTTLKKTPFLTILQKGKPRQGHTATVVTDIKARALILCAVLTFGILAMRR